MAFDDEDILHKGLKKFWVSGGKNVSGIQPAQAKNLGLALVHLSTAQCIGDIQNPYPKDWRFHKLEGTPGRYSIDINGNYRLTFVITNDATGEVCDIKYEDTH